MVGWAVLSPPRDGTATFLPLPTPGHGQQSARPGFHGLPSQYLTQLLHFMILPPKPCLFLPILSLFAANQLKRLSMNNLHEESSVSSQGWSSLIKLFFQTNVPANRLSQYFTISLMFPFFAALFPG